MKKHTFAHFSLLFVAFIWGVTFVVVQQAIDLLDPFAFNGVRFFLAACLLWFSLFFFKRKELKKINLPTIVSGAFLGFWLFIGYAFQTFGLLYTSVSKAGFITGLSVVLVPLLAGLILKEYPAKNAIIGVGSATLGLYLLTMTDINSLNLGDGLVLICALGFALHIIFTSKYSKNFPILLLTAVQISTVAILAIFSSILFEDGKQMFDMTIILAPQVFSGLLITAFMATSLAFFIQTNFQKFVPPTRVALIFATEPIFAAVAGYYWINDQFTITTFFGCAFILAGMIISEGLPRRRLLKKNL